ncbi:MAG: right-handed parallel beta-helix repeat-containing protein, partial [Bacteroidetes bacterium]
MTKQVNIFSLFVFLFLNLNAQTSLETEKIINAKDYGIYPNTFENIAPLFNKMVDEIAHFPLVKLVFEKGRYDIWPESSPKREYFISNTSTERECPSKIKTIALLFENFKDIVIEGNGALFMIHGKMINFAFDHCENIKIQNISFDYERPTMSELTFDEVTDRIIIATINPSSTYTIIDNKLKFYGEGWTMKHDHAILIDPELSAFYYSKFSPLRKSKATELAPFKIKFKGDFSRFKFKKGQVLTVRDPIRDQVGAFIAYSKNVVLQNVQMHYMHGMGIINQFNENVTLDKVIVKPRKETGRKIAAFADCFHFSGCKGQIIIENCETGGGHDDPVNVHGTHLKITKRVSDDKINIRFMHGQTYGLDAFFRGDTLDFVHAKSLQIYGTAQVKEVKKINDRDLQLTLTNTIPKGFQIGDVVENITWTPSVIIR